MLLLWTAHTLMVYPASFGLRLGNPTQPAQPANQNFQALSPTFHTRHLCPGSQYQANPQSQHPFSISLSPSVPSPFLPVPKAQYICIHCPHPRPSDSSFQVSPRLTSSPFSLAGPWVRPWTAGQKKQLPSHFEYIPTLAPSKMHEPKCHLTTSSIPA